MLPIMFWSGNLYPAQAACLVEDTCLCVPRMFARPYQDDFVYRQLPVFGQPWLCNLFESLCMIYQSYICCQQQVTIASTHLTTAHIMQQQFSCTCKSQHFSCLNRLNCFMLFPTTSIALGNSHWYKTCYK